MERLIFGEYEITEDLVAPFLQVFQMKNHTGIIADAVGGRQLFGIFFQQIDIFKPYRSGGVLTDQRDPHRWSSARWRHRPLQREKSARPYPLTC